MGNCLFIDYNIKELCIFNSIFGKSKVSNNGVNVNEDNNKSKHRHTNNSDSNKYTIYNMYQSTPLINTSKSNNIIKYNNTPPYFIKTVPSPLMDNYIQPIPETS